MAGRNPGKRIVRALEALVKARTPAARLDAARRARNAAEELEQDHVEAARDAGMTWAEIGKLYGLTKQGAQQRFRNGR